MRIETWRTGEGTKAVIWVQDDETVTVSVEVLHDLFTRLGWEETRDADNTPVGLS